jgi:hypothetical protein
MMRRFALVAALAAGASIASAQMPPSISKPIEQARKAADVTNAQTAAMNQEAKPAPVKSPFKAPAAAPAAAASKAAPAKAAAPARTPAAPQSAGAPRSAAGDSSKITFEREVFTYVSAGRRDPFASPIETGEIRPLVADLRVVGIIFDATGRNSVVVLRDASTQQQYRARPGQVLGRARVSQIKPKEIVLTIEEYGFSRQETLKLNVKQTQQTKGNP